MTVLVTGATGTVGSAVLRRLRESGVPARSAVRDPARLPMESGPAVRFDFTDPSTWPTAFAGVQTMFLVRPPALAHVARDMLPALRAARAAGVRHVVLLSVQGAGRNPVVPHARIESWLRDSGLAWTFVRPSFFLQNLTTTHVADLRDRDELVLPAGHGRTAFVDAEDVAAVAVEALRNPAEHTGRVWTPTGPSADTYDEVVRVVSEELGRPLRYTPVGPLGWMHHARGVLRMPWPMVGVTLAIYLTARLGLADGLTDDVRTVTGREPIDLAGFVRRERAAWVRPG